MGFMFEGANAPRNRVIKGLATATALTVLGATTALSATLYVNDSGGRLGTIDTATGEVNVVGQMTHRMTDIAFAPDGTLYGIDFSYLYSIDHATGVSVRIGQHHVSGGNGLVFGTDGTLYGAGYGSTGLFSLDVNTGAGSFMFDMHHASGGDLAFQGGDLYMASSGGELVSISTGESMASAVGSFGVGGVYGIATDETSSMFAVAGTQGYRIDPTTGAATPAFSFGGQGLTSAWGQAFYGESTPFGGSGANVSAVPVPAGLPLLLTAVAGFGLIARRKRNA